MLSSEGWVMKCVYGDNESNNEDEIEYYYNNEHIVIYFHRNNIPVGFAVIKYGTTNNVLNRIKVYSRLNDSAQSLKYVEYLTHMLYVHSSPRVIYHDGTLTRQLLTSYKIDKDMLDNIPSSILMD